MSDKYSNFDNTFFIYMNEDVFRVGGKTAGAKIVTSNAKVSALGIPMEKYMNMAENLHAEKSMLFPKTSDLGTKEMLADANAKNINGEEESLVMHFQHENGSKLIFRKFSRKEEKTIIHGGDIVWINHLEYELSLIA